MLLLAAKVISCQLLDVQLAARPGLTGNRRGVPVLASGAAGRILRLLILAVLVAALLVVVVVMIAVVIGPDIIKELMLMLTGRRQLILLMCLAQFQLLQALLGLRLASLAVGLGLLFASAAATARRLR